MRPGEVDGKSYHFVSRDEFQRLITQGAFLEHAEFGGNMYGTSAKAVEMVSSAEAGHRRAILDIDAQGVKLIKANHAELNPVYIFLSPPQYHVLRQRLEDRDTDHKEDIARRLKMAVHELHYARKPNTFDYVIVNDDLDHAYHLLRSIVNGTADRETFDQIPPADAEETAAVQAVEAAGETLA